VARVSSRYSRKRFTLRQHAVLLCLEVKRTTTYLDVVDELVEMSRIRDTLDFDSIPCPRYSDPRSDRVHGRETLELVLRERDVCGTEVLTKLLDGAGADDRCRDVGVVELPRESDLCGSRFDFLPDRLEDVERVLAPVGVVLLLVSSLTGYDAVLDRAASCGFAHEVVIEESYPFETLSVLALTRERVG